MVTPDIWTGSHAVRWRAPFDTIFERVTLPTSPFVQGSPSWNNSIEPNESPQHRHSPFGQKRIGVALGVSGEFSFTLFSAVSLLCSFISRTDIR